MPINGGSRKAPITLPGSLSSSKAGHMSLLRSLDTSNSSQGPLGKDAAALWNEQKRKIFGGVHLLILLPWVEEPSCDHEANRMRLETLKVGTHKEWKHLVLDGILGPLNPLANAYIQTVIALGYHSMSTPVCSHHRENQLLILSHTFLFCLDFPFFLSQVSTVLCPPVICCIPNFQTLKCDRCPKIVLER